jgi:ligand-binding SRPBCC domain-containing protein
VKVNRFAVSQRLAVAPDAAWTFFSDPGNLPHITPPWLGFEVVDDLPPRMYAGMIVRYRVRPLGGIPLSWITEITHVREGEFFVDEQRFGPYRFWHHQHHFRAVAGGTEAEDVVHYALPADPVSRPVTRLLVGRRLDQIFAFRRRVLAERFGEIPEAP